MTAHVHLGVEDRIATITLDRAEKLNAFDESVAEEWTALVTEAVSRDDVAAIVLAGEGRAFCAGGDVAAMAGFDHRAAELTRLAGRINVGLLALLESAIPVVAAAHGTTAGGGLGLLLASDYAIAGESSQIGSLYAGVGLTPDMSVSALLASAVGERRALQLVLQHRLLDAAEARDWGLVAEVVPDAEVRERAAAVARGWVAQTPAAYGQAKRLIRAGTRTALAAQLADEARTIGAASEGPEGDPLIRAFASRSR